MSVARWVFAAGGYLLLIVAWALATPLGAQPDEAAQAVRAAGAAVGQWSGQPVAPYRHGPGLTSAQADYLNQQTVQLRAPSGLVAPLGGATATADWVTLTTYATTASPLVYAIAGAGMRLAPDNLPAPYLGRLALGLACALLLAAAAWAVGGRSSAWPALGLALAATPAVVLAAAGLGTTGVAVCATLAFAANLFAIWTGAPRRGSATVLLAGVSGAVLALSRPSGLLALAAVAAVALPLIRLRLLFRPALLVGLAIVTAGAAISVDWTLTHQPSLPAGGSALTDVLAPLGRLSPGLAQQVTGPWLPALGLGAWLTMTVLLIGTALVIGRWRDRLALAIAAGAVVAGAYALVLLPVGWEPLGRYVLAEAVVVPLLAGFVLHQTGLRPRLDTALLGLVVAGLQFAAFWRFAQSGAATPPGGWMPWLVAAGAGAVLLGLSHLPLVALERDDLGMRLLDPDLVSISR